MTMYNCVECGLNGEHKIYMKIEVGFGAGTQVAEIPEENLIKILRADVRSQGPAGEQAVLDSLSNPVESLRLKDMVKPGEKISIITSDITRPMPTWAVAPHVLDELYEAGVSKSDITLVFALGAHRPHTEEEMIELVGERVYSEVRCVDSNPADCISMGFTRRGTPIDITRIVAEADRRICLGNIEYHYFAGYSGGAKALMPGVSTPEAIQVNHKMMTDPDACIGKLDGNPIREDVEEAAGIVGIDFICNVVLDENKKIIHAVSGDVTAAHREGCAFLDGIYQVKIPELADIVIVSQGGAPKDMNLYQTQKALDNSKFAVKDGGTIILVGSCREGSGNKVFEEWMTSAKSPEEITERIRREFKLGGHKAAAIAMVMAKAQISMVSEMEPEFVRTLFMEPYCNLQQAFDDAIKKHGKDAKVVVMPYGGSTLPKLI